MWILAFLLSLNVCFASSKEETLKHLGKFAYEVNYFEEAKFKSLEVGPGETERHHKDPGYRDLYQRYLAYGVKSQLEKANGRFPASVEKTQESASLALSAKQNLGLVAFKRGDLAKACPLIVEKAKAYGVDRIAYFHPVHFSGGNSENYKMPKNPVYGVHWRYEVANNFSQEEFEKCMNMIADAGLKLHYIPHLESIAALVDSSKDEWRMLSGIPIDDWYFHHSFGPLLTYLKKFPQSFRKNGDLDFTLAAEIDPMVIVHARKVMAGMAWLKSQLTTFGSQGARYFINTNGDFYHGLDLISKKDVSCTDVSSLISRVDGLTPSMYGDKGHLIKKDNKLDLNATISSYKNSLMTHLGKLCPEEKKSISEIVEKTAIGFGEFAVDEKDPEQSYTDILQNANQSILFVQYWNYGKWDHLGILSDGDKRLKKELLMKPKVRK